MDCTHTHTQTCTQQSTDNVDCGPPTTKHDTQSSRKNERVFN